MKHHGYEARGYKAHGYRAGASAALSAALWGAAAAFVVMSLFVGGLFYLDFCNLGTLLRRSADGFPLWSLLWLPAVCAAIGFAIGPSIAGFPIADPDDGPG